MFASDYKEGRQNNYVLTVVPEEDFEVTSGQAVTATRLIFGEINLSTERIYTDVRTFSIHSMQGANLLKRSCRRVIEQQSEAEQMMRCRMAITTEQDMSLSRFREDGESIEKPAFRGPGVRPGSGLNNYSHYGE